MTIKGWKIWYRDSTFDSTQGPWEQAPTDGIIAVMAYYDEADPETGDLYRDLHEGADHYGFDGKHFSLSEDAPESGLKDKHQGPVKHGSWASDADYQKITKRALEDHGHGWLLPKRKAAAQPTQNPGLKAA